MSIASFPSSWINSIHSYLLVHYFRLQSSISAFIALLLFTPVNGRHLIYRKPAAACKLLQDLWSVFVFIFISILIAITSSLRALLVLLLLFLFLPLNRLCLIFSLVDLLSDDDLNCLQNGDSRSLYLRRPSLTATIHCHDIVWVSMSRPVSQSVIVSEANMFKYLHICKYIDVTICHIVSSVQRERHTKFTCMDLDVSDKCR